MQRKDTTDSDTQLPTLKKIAHVVTADSVEAEEVPTIPLGSLQTISALEPVVSVHAIASTQTVNMPAPLVAQPTEYRRTMGEWFQVWWDGIRPSYLSLSILPVLVGSTIAWTQTISAKSPLGHIHPLRFIATLLAVIFLQLGAHLVNDYYDYLRGVDTTNSLGPGGLIQQGLIRPARVLSFGLLLLGLGVLFSVMVATSSGPLILLFGLIGLLCAYFYSATSRSLSSSGLGELVSFCIFGPLITLAAYAAQTGRMDRTALLYSLPLGLLAAAAIHANNMRDAESDAQAGKRTLASLLDLRWSRLLYLLLVLGAYITILALGLPHHAPHLVLITLWTLPLLVVVISGALRADTPPALHLLMRQTLRLEIFFTLLLVVALFASTFFAVLPHIPSMALPL